MLALECQAAGLAPVQLLLFLNSARSLACRPENPSLSRAAGTNRPRGLATLETSGVMQDPVLLPASWGFLGDVFVCFVGDFVVEFSQGSRHHSKQHLQLTSTTSRARARRDHPPRGIRIPGGAQGQIEWDFGGWN